LDKEYKVEKASPKVLSLSRPLMLARPATRCVERGEFVLRAKNPAREVRRSWFRVQLESQFHRLRERHENKDASFSTHVHGNRNKATSWKGDRYTPIEDGGVRICEGHLGTASPFKSHDNLHRTPAASCASKVQRTTRAGRLLKPTMDCIRKDARKSPCDSWKPTSSQAKAFSGAAA
jgi:hypothetical protein